LTHYLVFIKTVSNDGGGQLRCRKLKTTGRLHRGCLVLVIISVT